MKSLQKAFTLTIFGVMVISLLALPTQKSDFIKTQREMLSAKNRLPYPSTEGSELARPMEISIESADEVIIIVNNLPVVYHYQPYLRNKNKAQRGQNKAKRLKISDVEICGLACYRLKKEHSEKNEIIL